MRERVARSVEDTKGTKSSPSLTRKDVLSYEEPPSSGPQASQRWQGETRCLDSRQDPDRVSYEPADDRAGNGCIRSGGSKPAKYSLVLRVGFLFGRLPQEAASEGASDVGWNMQDERREEQQESRMQYSEEELTDDDRKCAQA